MEDNGDVTRPREEILTVKGGGGGGRRKALSLLVRGERLFRTGVHRPSSDEYDDDDDKDVCEDGLEDALVTEGIERETELVLMGEQQEVAGAKVVAHLECSPFSVFSKLSNTFPPIVGD